jgi:pyridoxamine 5'-phosphate oxidase
MDVYLESVARFEDWWRAACEADPEYGPAMTLSTVKADGQPSARTVLLKHFDERGFVFYTNTRSRKGAQLDGNPRTALCFFWRAPTRQVLVEGRAEQVDDAEADGYWATRARLSQIGAWASEQSALLDSRETMEDRLATYSDRFSDRPVPRPPYWTGFRVRPNLIEFWEARRGRLHDRERYWIDGGAWTKNLVYP